MYQERIKGQTYHISDTKEATKKSTIQTSYDCEICNDFGFVYDKKTNSSKPCTCKEIKDYKKILENSNISNHFLEIGFKEFETKSKHITVREAKNSAIAYFKNFLDIRDSKKNSIAFLSKSHYLDGKEIKTGIGAGKTHLSIALANNIMNKYKIGVLYMPYRDVVTKLKQNMIDEEYYQKQINKFKNASVLLIDDLFKGKVTESDVNIMFEIINHRYLNRKPIIVSSEYDRNKLVDFDQAVGSRIIELSKDYLVEIGLSKEEVIEGKTINYRLL